MSATRGRLWLERGLMATAIVCLGWYGYVTLEGAYLRHELTAASEQRLPAAPTPTPVTSATPVAPSAPVAPGFIGLLDIPRLRLSTPVLTGDDEKTLQVAAGHLPDTPRPWEEGNSAIAAHRDGLFRPLRRIRVGDTLRVRTTRGTFEYTVSELSIVAPDDLSVLEPTDSATLTLITCYPFNYVGAAPKRFNVRATRSGLVRE